jgi:hypothetical protein
MHLSAEDSVEYKENFWAYSKLCDLCDDDPEICLKAIEIIRSKDGSEKILSNLAAGPLEDLLSQHGEIFIERFEKMAKVDAQFKKLLGAVWQNSIPDHIWKRIKSVAGKSW